MVPVCACVILTKCDVSESYVDYSGIVSNLSFFLAIILLLVF